MKIILKSSVLFGGLFLLGASPMANAAGGASTDALVRKAMGDKIELSQFITNYGTEVFQEQNFSGSGQMTGSLHGSIHGIMLGNLPALASGLLGDGVNAITETLKGLSNTGLLWGSVNGQAQGSMQQTGVEIHDSPNLFVIVAKNKANFKSVVDTYQRSIGAPFDNSSIRSLMTIYNAPYIADEVQISHFNSLLRQFSNDMDEADEAITGQPGTEGYVEKLKELRAWGNSRRVIVSMAAGNGPIPAGDMEKICQGHMDIPGSSSYLALFSRMGDGVFRPSTQCLVVAKNNWRVKLNNDPDFKPQSIDSNGEVTDPDEPFTSSSFMEDKGSFFGVEGVMPGDELSALFDPKNMVTNQLRILAQ
jgi:hypothetical protein